MVTQVDRRDEHGDNTLANSPLPRLTLNRESLEETKLLLEPRLSAFRDVADLEVLQ